MQIRSNGKKYRTESELRELVLKYEASGMKQAVFCECEGVGLSSLHKWLKKYSSTKDRELKPKKVSFVELIDKKSLGGGNQYQIELELPQGIVLRLS